MIFVKKFYQISHKKQEGVRISIVTTKCKDVFETDAVHLRQSELMQKRH